MTLREAIQQIPAEEDLYASARGLYIVRARRLCPQDNDGLFLVLYQTEYCEWKAGSIWFGLSTDTDQVIEFIEEFADRPFIWLTAVIADNHGENWDDWQIITSDSFAQYVREKVVSACS